MYNVVTTLAPSYLIGSSSLMQVTRTTIKDRIQFKFQPDQTTEYAALEHLVKSPKTYNGRNVVTTLVPSLLQVTRTSIQACSNFGHIPSPTKELAVLGLLKNQCIML